MKKILIVLSLLLPGIAGVQAANENLANARYYYLDFQTDLDLGNCRQQLIEDLKDELVHLTDRRERADAFYVVRVEQKKLGMRDTVKWNAAVFARDETLLFEAGKEETGWSLQSACEDAADDIAEALGDRIRDARVNRGQTPSPTYLVEPELPSARVAPAAPIPPRSGAASPEAGGEYRMKERAIGEAAPVSAGETARVRGKWQGKASLFAQAHGCSQDFQGMQSLPSGAEIYTTFCDSTGRTMITCSAERDCELSY